MTKSLLNKYHEESNKPIVYTRAKPKCSKSSSLLLGIKQGKFFKTSLMKSQHLMLKMSKLKDLLES